MGIVVLMKKNLGLFFFEYLCIKISFLIFLVMFCCCRWIVWSGFSSDFFYFLR